METIEKKTHTILVNREAGYIRYISLKTNMMDWYSYDEELLAVLTDKVSTDYERRTGRTRFEVRNSGTVEHIRAHDLALGCYMGRIKAASFLSDWKSFVDWKRGVGLTVDHIDGNGNNLTRWNLSLMARRTNVRKYDTVRRIRLPNAINAAFVGGRYRVEFLSCLNGKNTDGPLAALRFICDSAEDFTERLRWLTECRFTWTVPIKEDGKWVQSDGEYLYRDTDFSIWKQESLAMMDESDFVPSGDLPEEAGEFGKEE